MRWVQYQLISAVLLLGFSSSAFGVDLQCKWSIRDWHYDTFVVDLKDGKAYWVNQDQNMKVVKINSGLVVLSGKRDLVQDTSGKWLENVEAVFAINRISGDLTVTIGGATSRGSGDCKVGRVF